MRARAVLGVVVDDEHLVDHARRVEAVDDAADRVALRVGHQHDRDFLVVPHRLTRRAVPARAAV
jgi:hypothetical protein